MKRSLNSTITAEYPHVEIINDLCTFNMTNTKGTVKFTMSTPVPDTPPSTPELGNPSISTKAQPSGRRFL